jgi:hypothetical protein
MIPDYGHPVWLVAAAFAPFLFGLMVWFPIHYWRKDRARRREAEKRP